jgi:hypothetical protein
MRWYHYLAYFLWHIPGKCAASFRQRSLGACLSESVRIAARGRIVLPHGECRMGLVQLFHLISTGVPCGQL